jgi:hypothetical protein
VLGVLPGEGRRRGFTSVVRFKSHRSSWGLVGSRSCWMEELSVGVLLGSGELLVGAESSQPLAHLRGLGVLRHQHRKGYSL